MLFGANSLLASTFVLLLCLQANPNHAAVTCQEQDQQQQQQQQREELFLLSAAPLNSTLLLLPPNSSTSWTPMMPNEDDYDCSKQLNLTDVIHRKFVYLFNTSANHHNQEAAEVATATTTTASSLSVQVPSQSEPVAPVSQPPQAHKCSTAANVSAAQPPPASSNDSMPPAADELNHSNNKTKSSNQDTGAKQNRDHHQHSTLETRTTNQQATAAQHSQDDPLASTADSSPAQPSPTSARRNYFRVLNRVFSRVELPDVFRRSPIRTPTNQQQQPYVSSSSSTSSGSGSSSSGVGSNSLCTMHIGCIDELPNFPSLLKLRPNVSATFTVYSRENPRSGHRIQYEPLMHYQLQDANVNELKLTEIQMKLHQQQQEQQAMQHQAHPPVTQINQLIAQPLNNFRLVGADHHLVRPNNPIQSLANSIGHGHRRSGGVGVLAIGKPPTSPQSLLNKRLQQQPHHQSLLLNPAASSGKKLLTTANNWLSATKVAHSVELPFDLSALERTNFNSSLTTRVIIGGYFAKEDEEWVGELVKAWLQLEPCNVIKVSWQDSNRGLYHTAAYNSRIVGRQLSLFLHYLNELFRIDLNKFHLVGHSLGAHIAGFVGADLNSQIARITGLDPAGPIFVDLTAAHRLDPTDAKFVDVLHTNGGTITKGALGLSTPSGHVDFYCNGGSLQPGCYFSSVTRSIMDPVERVACNHRRSYRYFTEIIKMAASAAINNSNQLKQQAADPNNEQQFATGTTTSSKFPEAYLFHAKQEELVRLVQPELSILADGNPRKSRKISPRFDSPVASIEQYVTQHLNYNNNNYDEYNSFQDMSPPLKWQIEFHSLNPKFPISRRGQYFFRTRSEAPFFSSRQFAITIRSEQSIKRKIALLAKINNSQVAEIELDELDGSFSFVFVPNDPKLLDFEGISQGLVVPDLWLMWKHRSFNLLLGQQNEIQLNSIELNLLENYPTNNFNSYQLVGDSDLVEELINSTTATIFDDSQTPSRSRSSSSGQELNIDLGGGGGGGGSATPTTTSAPIRVVEYKLTTAQTNSHLINNRNSQETGSSASLVKQNNLINGNHFSLFRNQWHKFEGKPIVVK